MTEILIRSIPEQAVLAIRGVVPPGLLCDDDVSTAFRGNGTLFRNLDAGRGAIGLRSVSTTALTNGQHTLSWSVTDSANRSEGIGSRYITVVNSAADGCSAECAVRRAEQVFGTSERRNLGTSIYARTGFDLQSAFTPLAVGAAGVDVYVALLARLGRYDEAIEAAATLLPEGVRSSGFAPSLIELSRSAGKFDKLLEVHAATHPARPQRAKSDASGRNAGDPAAIDKNRANAGIEG